MPLGDFKSDAKTKIPLRKALSILSPLLIVSIGIHGLALLLPIPEKVEIVEKEPDLPEPIQVSELPEIEIPQEISQLEPATAPVVTPAIRPETPAPVEQIKPQLPQPPPLQPTASSPPALDPPAPDPIEQLPSREDTPTPEATQAEPAPQSSRPTSQNPPANTATPSRNIEKDRSPASRQEILDQLNSIVQIDEFNAIEQKQIKAPLFISFPSDDICLEDNPTTIRSSAVVVFEDDQGTTALIDGAILDPTSYKLVGKWLDKTIFSSNQVDPNEPETIKIPSTPDFDPVQWVLANYDKPLFDAGEAQKAFTFVIEVQVSMSSCE